MDRFKVNTDNIDDYQIRIIGTGDRKTAEGREEARRTERMALACVAGYDRNRCGCRMLYCFS